MKRRIIIWSMIILMVGIIISNVATVFTLKQSYDEESKRIAKGILEILSSELPSASYNQFVREKASAFGEGLRLTVIASDGIVLGDSEADIHTMQNHSGRKEILDAYKNPYGEDIRYSETTRKDMLYVAKTFGDRLILRASMPLSNEREFLKGILPTFIVSGIFALILVTFLVNRISKRLLWPLFTLEKNLHAVVEGDLESSIPDSEYEELDGLVHDIRDMIHKLRRQFISLKEQAEKMDHIVAHMHEGLVLLDEEGKIILINQAAKSALSIAVGKLGEDIRLYIRQSQLHDAVQKAIHDQIPQVLDLNHKSQGKVLRYYFSPVYGSAGAILLISDVTVIKKAEQVRSDFVANVSHELKTPLTTIRGFAELINSGMVEDKVVMKQYTGLILNETDRLMMLINDILTLAEIEDATIEMMAERVDLYKAACEVSKQLEELAHQKEVKLIVSGQGAMVMANNHRIKEMLLNTVENAIKYNRKQGEVRIFIENEDEKAIITIEDTGIGIPKDSIDRIFERFYRVDKGRSKKTGGTGLGLSIVKHIVETYQGEIMVTSELGVGTKMKISFPESKL